jgi:hypothetical protein
VDGNKLTRAATQMINHDTMCIVELTDVHEDHIKLFGCADMFRQMIGAAAASREPAEASLTPKVDWQGAIQD